MSQSESLRQTADAYLEMVRRNPSAMTDHVPHARAVGLEVVAIERGRVLMKVSYRKDLVGNPATGVLHGGLISSLLDHCSGMSVTAAMETPQSIATLNLRIAYMKPATPDQDVFARAHCYKVTRSVAFVRAVAYHENEDDPIASSAGTFMLTSENVDSNDASWEQIPKSTPPAKADRNAKTPK